MLACIISQGGTDKPALFFDTEQIGMHSFFEAEQIGLFSEYSTSNLAPGDLHPPSTMFLDLIFWISQGLSYQIKTGLEGG